MPTGVISGSHCTVELTLEKLLLHTQPHTISHTHSTEIHTRTHTCSHTHICKPSQAGVKTIISKHWPHETRNIRGKILLAAKILMNVLRHQRTHCVNRVFEEQTFLYFNERVWAAVSKDTCSNIRKLGPFSNSPLKN